MNRPKGASRRMHRHPIGRRAACIAWIGLLSALLAGCANANAVSSPTSTIPPIPSTNPTQGRSAQLPHFDHIVVVVEENHSYDDIMASGQAHYIHKLVGEGALFTDAHAVAHPSEPNYLALYAGSTFGLTSDACPQQLAAPNLGAAALARGV